GAPATTTATAGAESATVNWSTPTWNSGSPITGYRIEQSSDGAATWTTVIADTGSTATEFTVSPLTAGAPVQFRVTGINAHGIGTVGSPSASVTPFTVPGAPV